MFELPTLELHRFYTLLMYGLDLWLRRWISLCALLDTKECSIGITMPKLHVAKVRYLKIGVDQLNSCK